jgi:methylated-DNA-[protein]-cysteine S-methyltransferase
MPSQTLTVSRATYDSPIGRLALFATKAGLLCLALPPEAEAWGAKNVARMLGGSPAFVDDAAPLRQTIAQLDEYFAGKRRVFDLPLDPRGSDFQRAVWQAIAEVPYGATTTYAAIARAIGRPDAVRAVGAANGANPLPIVIPCHRVVGANGALTGYGGGLELKARLLELEGGLV